MDVVEPGAVIKTKWKSMKDTFRREMLNSQKTGKSSNWLHYERLMFLKEVYEFKDRKRKPIPGIATSFQYDSMDSSEVKEEDEIEMEIPRISSVHVLKQEVLDSDEDLVVIENENGEERHAIIQNSKPAAPVLQKALAASTPIVREEVYAQPAKKLKTEAEDAEKMFLLSLLPDIEPLSNRQMREFKRRVTGLVKSILDS